MCSYIQNKSQSDQYLTFMLRDETFALGSADIIEVVDYGAITPVPHTPDTFCGVMNLRGNVISVVDLGLIIGLPIFAKSFNTSIVIVETLVEGEYLKAGGIVDAVQAVTYFDSAAMGPPPLLGMKINSDFIRGVLHCQDGYITILNIDKMLLTIETQITNERFSP